MGRFRELLLLVALIAVGLSLVPRSALPTTSVGGLELGLPFETVLARQGRPDQFYSNAIAYDRAGKPGSVRLGVHFIENAVSALDGCSAVVCGKVLSEGATRQEIERILGPGGTVDEIPDRNYCVLTYALDGQFLTVHMNCEKAIYFRLAYDRYK